MLSAWRRVVRSAPTVTPMATRVASQQPVDAEQFAPLDLGRRRQEVRRTREQRAARAVPPPRRERQSPTQQWSDVWPAARSFHPAAVPLPVRQGFVARPTVRAPPGPEANAELMKVANFLHLTPPAVARHCAALRRFCTRWPAALTERRLDELRPLRVTTHDFVHATPTVRHPDARVATVRLPVDRLRLAPAERDKLLRLVGDRYSVDTDLLTIVADRCPFRRQNVDYALYLLTVLYHESRKREPWEALRVDADVERFEFAGSPSEAAVARLGAQDSPAVASYAEAVTQLHNVGEDETTLAAYRRAVLDLLELPAHVGTD